MNQKRKAKLKHRAESQQRSQQKKRDLAIGAMKHADVYDAFCRLPTKTQSVWLSLVQPVPEVVLHESTQGCEHAQKIPREFPSFVRDLLKNRKHLVTPAEYYSFLWPLRVIANDELKKHQQRGDDLQTAPACHVVALVSQLQAFLEQHQTELESDFAGAAWMIMLCHSIYDERFFWHEFVLHKTPGRRTGVQVVVHRTIPERVQMTVDDRPRRAFRCCTLLPNGGLNEIAWTGREIGFADDEQKYPVYMQSHVLEQLSKRAPCSRIIFPIVSSLLWPEFLPMGDDHFLVEFYHLKYKLGYFVALRLADRILLKTFLFLTMQGTPESDLLYRRLHLTRRDIEYLKLDELAAFRDPEVRNDSALVQLLNECGCGHLLTLTAPDLPKEIPTGYADTIRKYLGTNIPSVTALAAGPASGAS